MDVQHTAIRVSDLSASKAFYEDGLDLRYSHDFHTDAGVHNYYVTGEDLDTAIQLVHDPGFDGELDPSGIVHLALRVPDAAAVDDTFERVVAETNCPVVAQSADIDAAGARAAFVRDPDGYEIEIFAPIE